MSAEPEWCEYEPPASAMAAAIQYPLDERWEARVLNAYRKDTRRARSAGIEVREVER